MADASFVQTSFLGGEWSKSMQGRTDRPDYRTSLNVCLNSFPLETGAWVRRPGTMFCGTTRGGLPGRLVKFDFQTSAPYNMEFTDSVLRMWNGPSRVTTNDDQTVVSISTANPAKVATGTHGWATGNRGFFKDLGADNPLLQNRVFIITVTSATEFTLTDEITGATIDGATLGSFVAGAFSRILEITTIYGSSQWSTLRSVQTEAKSFLLNGAYAPYALTVATQPTAGKFATFALAGAVFNDGPYLDPFENGVQANPSAKVGVISLTLTFPAYDATVAYAAGSFVTSSSVNYRSRVDQNVGNTPVSSPTQWAAVDAGTAIAAGGFQGSDVGRLVRFYSEPQIWAVGATYSAGDVVAYGGNGLAYAGATYWKALVGSNTGNVPGVDLTKWTLFPTGAIWTWGKITSLTNMISGTLSGSANIGDMSSGGGLAAAFDGTPSKIATAAASRSLGVVQLVGYIGKNYSGASDQRVGSVTVFPPTDQGFAVFSEPSRDPIPIHPRLTINLRGKATLPASGSDGTLIGTTGLINNTVSAVSIVSTDTTTAWKYVWIELIGETEPFIAGLSYSIYVGQLEVFSPLGSGSTSSNGVNVEILGGPLLYTTPIRTWRLGLYSNTTGWPTCGTYHEGRLWLSGAQPNRIDSSVSNGILGGTVNFAPTSETGAVATSNAISYVFNAEDTNPIFWMIPDLQGIICGTKAGEWLVQSPTTGGLAPTNIAARRVTKIGCANIEPRRTEHTTVYVQKFNRKVMEYFADVYSGKFTAPHLSLTGKHLTRGGINELAYQQELSPIVWARVAGGLIGCTYKRDTLATSQGPTIAGWHRHTLGSGRIIEGLCVGPSVDGTLDSLSMITNDPATNIRHVEIMRDIFEEGSPLASAWLLDDALVPSSTTTSNSTPAPYGGLTINGLWHHNGETVTVFASGLDCGDFVVADGSITVPYGDGISGGTGGGLFTADFAATATIVVGFTYTSDGQIVRPATPQESGARNGPAFGKTRRTQQYAIQVDNTAGLSIGTDFSKLKPVLFKSPAGVLPAVGTTFSGIYEATIGDEYGFDSMICWRSTRPLPATVIAIGGFLHTQDR